MTKTKKMILSAGALTVIVMPIMMISTASAKFEIDDTSGQLLGVSNTNNSNSVNLVDTIFTVIQGLLSVVFVIAVLMFVIAGLFFLTAAGSDRADQAREMITYAIIGLVVSVLGYAIVIFLSKALKGEDTAGI